jgi:orotidine-5'-phosphate decarboxylase
MEMFGDRLAAAVRQKKTPAMVGIDPRPDLLPRELVERFRLNPDAANTTWAEAVAEFCSRVIDVVSPYVAVVKFQIAFFELYRAPGITVLESLLRKARQLGLVTVLDAKRGDIGSTSVAYAESVFGALSAVRKVRNSEPLADAVTVSPYLGKDSLEPFLEYARHEGRGVFVLVRTSNPGSRDLQQLATLPTSETLYRLVAGWTQDWSRATRGQSGYGSVGAVVGATAGDQIAELRTAMPGTWLLIPGYGAQGGNATDIAEAFDERGLGAIVNNSREILFPKIDGDPAKPGAWEHAVEAAVKRMIDDLARHTPAGRLQSS